MSASKRLELLSLLYASKGSERANSAWGPSSIKTSQSVNPIVGSKSSGNTMLTCHGSSGSPARARRPLSRTRRTGARSPLSPPVFATAAGHVRLAHRLRPSPSIRTLAFPPPRVRLAGYPLNLLKLPCFHWKPDPYRPAHAFPITRPLYQHRTHAKRTTSAPARNHLSKATTGLTWQTAATILLALLPRNSTPVVHQRSGFGVLPGCAIFQECVHRVVREGTREVVPLRQVASHCL